MKKHFTLAILALLAVTTLAITVVFINARKPVAYNEKTLQHALKDVTSEIITPAVTDFSDSTRALQNAVKELCAAPSEETLATAQKQWKTTALDWGRLSNFVFGPLNDDLVFPRYTFIDSLRLRGQDYTATVRKEQQNDLAGDTPLNTEYFAGKTFQKVGLLALEVALFEAPVTVDAEASENTTNGDQSAAAIVAAIKHHPRYCQLTAGLAASLNNQGDYIRHGWLEQFKNHEQSFAKLFASNNTPNGADSLSRLLIVLKDNIEYIRKRNVALVIAQISGHNWAIIRAAIDEAELVFSGTPTTKVNYYALLEAAGHAELVLQMKEHFDYARQCIDEQNKINLDLALSMLEGNLKTNVPEAFGLDLGINFSDGD